LSRVYFNSPSGEAELLGAERHHLGALVRRIAEGFLNVGLGGSDMRDRYRQLITPGHFMHSVTANGPGWDDSLRLAFRSGSFSSDETLFRWKGMPLDESDLAANTAMAVGSDPIRLAARFDAQCEIHCWTEGPNRAWLAGLIDEGLESGVFRRDLRPQEPSGKPGTAHPMGWEQVTCFLRSRDDEPVVLSYSVTDGFPDRYLAGGQPPAGTELIPSWWRENRADWDALSDEERAGHAYDAAEELWSELPADQQWAHAMDALRQMPGLLELKPEGWADYKFGHCLSLLDLTAQDWQQRLDTALLDSEPAGIDELAPQAKDGTVCMLEPDQVTSPDQRNTLAGIGETLIEAVSVLGG
jgi:hypothetical protein